MNDKPCRRALIALVALAAAAGPLAGLVAAGSPAGATPAFSLVRIAGADRYATAVQVADSTYGTAAAPVPHLTNVILASGVNFPDALSASYLAGQLHTAILLTDPSVLSPATQAALSQFGTRTVDLVGGPGAVSDAVATTLATTMGLGVTRIYNQDGCATACNRYDTMESIDTFPGTTPSALPVNQRVGPTAILATGDNFPDALGAGALAVADHVPVILTEGSAPALSPQAQAVIGAGRITNLIAVGGPAALNPAQFAGLNVDTTATTGANRSDTSELLAADAVAHYGLSNVYMTVADGYSPAASAPGLPPGFTPDALTGSVFSGTGMADAPLLVTNSPTDPGAAADYARSGAATLLGGAVFGGSSALSDSALAAIQAAGRGLSTGGPGTTAALTALGTQGTGAGVRPLVMVKVGGSPPVPVVLDTGSSGLQLFSVALPVNLPGVTTSATPDTATYSDGSVYTGTVARATVTIGGVATSSPIPFGLVSDTTCTAAKPSCPAVNGPLSITDRGYFGILGIGLRPPPPGLTNPLLALPGADGQSWSVAMRGSTGALVLGAPAPSSPVATFHLSSLGAGPVGGTLWNDRPTACWTVGSLGACEPTLFDSGSPIAELDGGPLGQAPTTAGTSDVATGTPVTAALSAGSPPWWSFAAGAAASQNEVRVDPTNPSATVNASIEAFYAFTITYDDAQGTISLVPQG